VIRIHVAGLAATVQDAGRPGHLRSGVPEAGPADPFAFAAALALAGLPADAAAIEIVGLPFTFSCDDRRIVAVTGREVTLRGHAALPAWTAVLARPGQELTVRGTSRSRFAYLAVSGGIDLPPVLGSRATHLASATGPLPRALVAGDALPLAGGQGDPATGGTTIAAPGRDGPPRAIRTIEGPHAARFGGAATRAFFGEAFRVAAASDRMGVRLDGPDVAADEGELLTCGVVAGAVQVPRGGAPIVLLADHQTTGGYPVIATVIAADLGRVAQAAPGEELRFARVTCDEAVAALAEERRSLGAVRCAVR